MNSILKTVITDLDGTLLRSDRTVSEKDRQTLHVFTSYRSKLPGVPARVRHAWMNIAMPNLVNSARYPASVFEIDVKTAREETARGQTR